MVEVVEYALVVLVSSIVAGFSFGVYGGYASIVGPSNGEAAFATVVALAHAAIAQGNSTATLTIDQARVGCESHSLEFASPRFAQNSSLPVECSFPPQDISGSRRLTFEYSGGQLTLLVR